MVLEEQGDAVAYRTNGQDGMNELEQADFDVLLLDLKLPDWKILGRSAGAMGYDMV